MYFRDYYGTKKLCLFKEGRNEKESRDYIQNRVCSNEVACIIGHTGSGKSVFCNTLANELNELNYTVIYISEKETEELANAFHLFPAKENYHINMLEEQSQIAKTKPVMIYHPFSFNIPHKRKLPPINFFTYDIRKISEVAWRSIIASDSALIIDVCNDVSSSLNENDTIYDFLWKLYKDINKDEKELSFSPDDMFIPMESAGSKTTIKNVKLALKSFRNNFFIQPSNCKYHLDFVNLCNDNTNIHHLTTKWIPDKKDKIFTMIEFLLGIDNAIRSGEVKNQLVLVFEELKIMFPAGNLESYQTQLLNLVYKLFSRIRTKAYVIATAQSIFDMNWKARGLFSKKFLGRLSDNDVRILIKDFGLRTFDQYKLRGLKIGEFLLWESNEFNVEEQLSDKILVNVPPFSNHEQGLDFFNEYSKYFPDNLQNYTDLYKEFKQIRFNNEKQRKKELKEFQKEQKSKTEVKALKKGGKIEEARSKFNKIKKEKKELIEKQVYELKESDNDLSWSKIAKKVGLKHHDTARKYYDNYYNRIKDQDTSEMINKDEYYDVPEEIKRSMPKL